MARLLDFLDNEVLASAARMIEKTCKDVTVLLVSHSTPVKIYMQLFVGVCPTLIYVAISSVRGFLA